MATKNMTFNNEDERFLLRGKITLHDPYTYEEYSGAHDACDREVLRACEAEAREKQLAESLRRWQIGLGVALVACSGLLVLCSMLAWMVMKR